MKSMHAGTSGCDREVVPNTFASQYISIILIIFTCVVSAFFSGKGPSASPHAEAPSEALKPRHVVIQPEISRISLETLFNGAGTEVNEEAAAPLVMILQNHDLDAEFEIAVEESSHDRAFMMAQTLTGYFRANQIPAGAVKVFVVPGQGRNGVNMLLRKSRKTETHGGEVA